MELTRILDTLKDADGNLAQGEMRISCPAFVAADGTAVAAGTITKTITDGAVDLVLAPTEGSVKNDPDGGEARYTVRYKLANTGRYPETWAVPRTGGPFTIAQARGF